MIDKVKMRRCRQCGDIKPEEQFRQYYGRRKNEASRGRYKVCLTCEKINTRYKYLITKGQTVDLSNTETQEVEQTEKLYDMLRAEGLQPPATGSRKTQTMTEVERMIAERKERADELKTQMPPGNEVTVPPELLEWLSKDLKGLSPEYLQEDVYEKLQAKYRPLLKIDGHGNQIYDDTYRDTLNAILKRFDDYEEEYYSE